MVEEKKIIGIETITITETRRIIPLIFSINGLVDLA